MEFRGTYKSTLSEASSRMLVVKCIQIFEIRSWCNQYNGNSDDLPFKFVFVLRLQRRREFDALKTEAVFNYFNKEWKQMQEEIN